MKITPNFALVEFHGKDGTPYPSEWIESRLRPFCQDLEIIRAVWGKPLRIISAFRTPAHNAATGGAEGSKHMEGTAIDFYISDVAHKAVWGSVEALIWSKVIREGGLGIYSDHLHFDYRGGERARWSK